MNRREVLFFCPQNAIANSLPRELTGWRIHKASSVEQAKDLARAYDFRVGVACVGWGQDNGIHVPLDELYPAVGRMEWVALLFGAMLENPDVCNLVSAWCYDYHTLPLDRERLLVQLGHAYGMANVARCSARLNNLSNADDEEMVGTSESMRQVFRAIRKFASVDAPVLITGESGTGKELTAKAIHERSSRSKGPLVIVNCAALPSNLIQSELFGHEKGAFTGAHQRKIGRIEAASGGTIFLDEIGDLPLDLQINLLRFLQEKTIERVGGTESICVDVRVVAATNVDLEQAVMERKFREDLFYRLNVLHLEMPSLRERGDDVEVLAKYFFHKFSCEKKYPVKGFSQQALQTMRLHNWPGNVRELINRVRRALVMCENRLLSPSDLGLDRRAGNRVLRTLEAARKMAEKEAILSSLGRNRHNVTRAAYELGISRVTLYRLMDKHRISE